MSLERRIRNLEDHAKALRLTEEARQQREHQEVVSRLSDEDLRALDEVLTAAIERGGGSVTLKKLYEFSHERGRQALDAYTEALEALKRGEEPAGGSGERRRP